MTMKELTSCDRKKMAETLKQRGFSEEQAQYIIDRENDWRVGRGDFGPFPGLDDILKK